MLLCFPSLFSSYVMALVFFIIINKNCFLSVNRPFPSKEGYLVGEGYEEILSSRKPGNLTLLSVQSKAWQQLSRKGIATDPVGRRPERAHGSTQTWSQGKKASREFLSVQCLTFASVSVYRGGRKSRGRKVGNLAGLGCLES